MTHLTDDAEFAARVLKNSTALDELMGGEFRKFARGVAELGELSWFGSRKDLLKYKERLTGYVWPWVLEQQNERELIPWPAIAAATLEAKKLLRIGTPFLWESALAAHASVERERTVLRRPEVYALLEGSDPARVMLCDGSRTTTLGDLGRRCSSIVVRLLGVEAIDWTFDTFSTGNSSMLAVVLRTIAARWPESLVNFSAIGASGELDDDGHVLAVDAIEQKVRSFFETHPKGVCFVPYENLPALADQFAYAGKGRSRTYTPDQWLGIQPVRSVEDLLVRLGISPAGNLRTSLFERVRRQLGPLQDWRGYKVEDPRTVIDVPLDGLPEIHPRDFRQPPTPSVVNLASLARSPGQDYLRIAVTGRPGAGKSWLLQKLHRELNIGSSRLLGPSIRVDAKLLCENGRQSTTEVIKQSAPDLDADSVKAILQDESFRRNIWLLVDGLDEVPAHHRRSMLTILQDWPGPAVVTTRGLPEGLPNFQRMNILPLDSYTQKAALIALERDDLASHFGKDFELVPERPRVWSLAESVRFRLHTEGSRRNTTGEDSPLSIADTILGVSILAAVSPHGGPLVDRTQLMRGAIHWFVHRAEAEGRQPSKALKETRSLRCIGAAAWSMLSRGRAMMSSEDVEQALEHVPSAFSDVSAFDESLKTAGFLQHTGIDTWEFTHKSFAEYCAALHLRYTYPDGAALEVLRMLGNPGIDEVCLHLSALLDDATHLVERVLASAHRPFTALSMATRICAHTAKVEIELVVSVFEKRLRLATWFPDQDTPLPGQVSDLWPLWTAIERWQSRFSPHQRERLVAACHPDAQLWLRGDFRELPSAEDPDAVPAFRPGTRPPKDGCEDYNHLAQRRYIAESLQRTALLSVPLPTLLRMSHGPDDLISRGYSAAALEIRDLFHHPHVHVQEAARYVWLRTAPPKVVLDIIPQFESFRGDDQTFLVGLVALHGTEDQRRETLLRAEILDLERTIEESRDLSEMGGPQPADAARALVMLNERNISGAWRFAWDTGVLGWNFPNCYIEEGRIRFEHDIDFLYHTFVRDEVGEARFRALLTAESVSREHNWRTPLWKPRLTREPDANFRAQLVSMLDDPFEPAAVAAFRLAELLRLDLPKEPCLSALKASSLSRRFPAMLVLLTQGHPFSPEEILRLMKPEPVRRRSPSRPSAASFKIQRFRSTSWGDVIRHLDQVTFRAIIAELRRVHLDLNAVLKILTHLEGSELKATADAVQYEMLRDDEVAELVNAGRVSRSVLDRRAERQEAEQWDRDTQYEDDPHPYPDEDPISLHAPVSVKVSGECNLAIAWRQLDGLRGDETRRETASIANAIAAILCRGTETDATRLAQLPLGVASVAEVIPRGDGLRRLQNSLVRFRQIDWLNLVQEFGRLPEHALLLIPSCCARVLESENSLHVLDQAFTNENACQPEIMALESFAARCMNREAIRCAFLRATLWESESWSAADMFLRHLGGVSAEDVQELELHLRLCPTSPVTLTYLSAIGEGEEMVSRVWSELAVPWWEPTRRRRTSKNPQKRKATRSA